MFHCKTSKRPGLFGEGQATAESRGFRHFFLVIPLLFYWFTSAPTIGLGDTALLVESMQDMTINSQVNTHNITVISGWLFSFLPFGNMAFRGTLVSIFFGSLTVCGFYLLLFRMRGSRLVAATSSSILMVTHSLWWHSALVECYAVNGLFTVLSLACLVKLQADSRFPLSMTLCPPQSPPPGTSLSSRFTPSPSSRLTRDLLMLFFISGLAIFNHVQLGFIWCGGMVYLSLQIWEFSPKERNDGGRSLVLKSVAAFLIGFSPYLITFLRDVQVSGNFGKVVGDALGGSFKGLMFKGSFWGGLQDVGFLIFNQFPTPFLAMIPLGIVLLLREWGASKATAALTTMFAVNTYFFTLYNTWDKFAFLLPSFIILCFCGTFAVSAWFEFLRRSQSRLQWALAVAVFLVCIAFPPYFYSRLSVWGSSPGYWYGRYNNLHTINTHNVSEYIANPNKRNYYDIEILANLLFEKLPRNATFIDDDSRTYYPLAYYQRFYHQRPDLNIQLVNSWGFDNWGATSNQFANMIREAYLTNRDLFLISLGNPFPSFISGIPDFWKYRFLRFSLDDKRWVYKLATIKEMEAGSPPPTVFPSVEGVAVGVRFESPDPIVKTHFSRTDGIMGQISFTANVDPFYLSFHWLGPAGQVIFSSIPFLVPPGNTSVWSFLEKPNERPPGTWSLQIFSGEAVLGEIAFTVESE